MIEFDNNYLYIKSKRKNLTIPLENITTIKLIMMELGGADFYKIDFYDIDGHEDSIRLIPNNLFPYFIDFTKEKNKSLIIKNWTHSFDMSFKKKK